MARVKTRKIEKISVVDQVGNQIKERIISGEWKPGEKLPSESEIADLYGVNRLSVRLALQKLATLGIIETRVGEGSFVREFSFYPVLNEMAEFIQFGDRMHDIKEMRYLIERESAIKAAERCASEDTESMKEALNSYCEAYDRFNQDSVEKNLIRFIDSDLNLHCEIVRLSGNLLYLEIYQMIRKLVKLHITSLIEHRRNIAGQDGDTYRDMHIRLCDAILANDRPETEKVLSAILDVESESDHLI